MKRFFFIFCLLCILAIGCTLTYGRSTNGTGAYYIDKYERKL